MKKPHTLNDCYNILDLRELAQRRLPSPVFHFLEGAAETEMTARRNTVAFDDVQLIPRCLVDVATVTTATRILGQDLEWPVFCSPTGASRIFHPDGELAVARAAASAGTLYGVAAGSTYSLEEIAAASEGPKMFLLYPYKDREITWELIGRAKRAGYPALCLMVDVPAMGKRERDLRSGFGTWSKASWRRFTSAARHPAWAMGQLRRGPITLANFTRRAAGAGAVNQLDPSISWKDLGEIADRWGGPFALKGVMSAQDARRAADAGITAIIVSNHGGRQLDGAAASIEVLPEIVQAVGQRMEVILDGGIRRGVHVLKALALGANACSIGRPYLYGLSVAGEAGVAKALSILRAELELAMKLSGCADLKSIGATHVRSESDRTIQHVRARDIPIPQNLSSAAKAALLERAATAAPSYPAPDDKKAWHDYTAACRKPPKPGRRVLGYRREMEEHVTSTEADLGGAPAFLIQPKSGDTSGRILYNIHGGAFIGDIGEVCRRMTVGVAYSLAAKTYGVDYRTPPTDPYPAPLDDCLAGYAFLLKRYRPEQIVVRGISAGGNLAAAMMLRCRARGMPFPAGLILATPQLDLTESGDSFAVMNGVDVVLKGSLMNANLLYANGHSLTEPDLSPLFGNFEPGFPPTLLTAGTRDTFLSNAVRMHNALRRSGNHSELLIEEGMPHGGFFGAPEDDALMADIREFAERAWAGKLVRQTAPTDC
jgi:L-lactate dehydrogenase (cytochrome)